VQEVWAQLDEFEDYSISNLGRVRNDIRDSLVALSLTQQGAVKVGLMKGGRQHTRSVKVLVAETFVPRDNPLFNSPINLDCNPRNNQVGNIVWRPRWFAWRYTQQLVNVKRYRGVGPVVNVKTGAMYADVVEAAMTNGLLFSEVELSVVNQIPVFPSWHLYAWA